MSPHPAIALVHALRKRGVELAASLERDRVLFRPKAAVTTEEVELLGQHRGVVLALLQAESRANSGQGATANTDARLDSTLLAVLSVFPGAHLVGEGEPWPRRIAPVFEAAPVGCRACGGARFWRLRGGREWVCSLCHAPLPLPERVEWSDGGRR